MAAGWEIERRYLVRVPGSLWSGLGEGVALRQGYVLTGPVSVRIRTGEPRGPVLAVKSGGGIRRREVETLVPVEMAEALFEASAGRIVEKRRFRLGAWELDRFQGALTGLSLMEIELEAVDQPTPEPPSGISIIREVTDDNTFTNAHLAVMDEATAQAFVAQAYAGAEG